jgi:hypothetical protein
MARINASLFKNDRKEGNQPDYTGPGSVSKEDFMAIADQVTSGRFNSDDRGNIKIKVAGWKKTSAGGKSYLSLSIQVDDYGIDQPKAAPAVTITDNDDF